MDDHLGDESIDVALDVMAKQGFDTTTMAQIAEALGEPLDTVVRRFGTKDAIVLTVADEMRTAVVNALAAVDANTPAVDALMAAHSKVVADIVAGAGPITVDRMRLTGVAIMASPDLQKKSSTRRAEMLSVALANRLGVRPDDKQVRRALTLWSAVVAGTYVGALDKRGRYDPEADARKPEGMPNRLNRSFRIITGRQVGK